MNFVEQLQQLDFKDIGRWPFVFRALGVAIMLVVASGLLIWYFVIGENGSLPLLRKAEAEQKSLWATFDDKQRKAANLEAYRQQLAEIDRTFGAMLRQLPGRTEVPSLLIDISQQVVSGQLDLEALRDVPPETSYEHLTSIKGLALHHADRAVARAPRRRAA